MTRGTVLAGRSAMALTVIAGSANVPLARSVSAALGVKPGERTLLRFADGELHVEIEESIRGHDVYVIEPTSLPVDEHVLELLFLADACRRAGAARLTAVVPYFGYARQDRRASGREAVGARVVAGLIETAGFARISSRTRERHVVARRFGRQSHRCAGLPQRGLRFFGESRPAASPACDLLLGARFATARQRSGHTTRDRHERFRERDHLDESGD